MAGAASLSVAPSGSLADSAGDADWAARSTAAGVILADRLGTSAKFTPVSTVDANNWVLNDGQADHVTFDSTIKPHASSGGSLKFSVLSADGANSGNFGIYFGNLATFGNGDTFWYSYRFKAPANYLFQAHTVSSTDESSRGQKISILSDRLSSSRANETVFQMTSMAGLVRGYHQDGSSFPGEDVGASTACSGSDFNWSPEIDHGSNPLSGTNPDTGSAWSACEQDRARYGGLYSAQSLSQFMRGLGDPLSGGFRPVPGEWVTVTGRVEVGTFGTASSRFSGWAAHEGQPYQLLWDSQNITLGSGVPDYNCLWLLPYATNRQAGGRKWTSKTSNIGGITVHTVGTSTPTGDGTLEYVASTGRFRWQSAGGSFGTARGYSVANGITLINVEDGSQRGLVIEITNPSALPASGTTTDTVTIASGRFDTQINYCDPIISTLPINAPGGYAPAGVSVIADAAAGMSSGSWLQLTGGNLPSGLGNYIGGPTSGIKTFYAINMAYLNGKAYWIGSDHNAPTDFIEYDFATNAISILAAPPWNNTIPPNHGYNHIATVGSTLWACGYNENNVYRWNGGSSWTQVSYNSTGVAPSAAKGVAFHPNMGANGTILVFQLYSAPSRGTLIGIDPVTLAVRTIVTPASAVLEPVGSYHNFAVYNPVSDVVFFGGGNSQTTCWTINASETVVAKAAIPAGLSNMGPATGMSRVYADPVSGNFIGMRNTTDWQTFNPTANTWSAHAGTVSMLSSNVFDTGNRIDGVVGVDLRDLGVSLFIKAYSSGSNAQAWLWKP